MSARVVVVPVGRPRPRDLFINVEIYCRRWPTSRTRTSGRKTTMSLDLTPATSRSDPSGRGAGHRSVLVVMCLALATVVSAVASLNVAIPSIARDTHASLTELSWVVDAYALVFAALLLPAGAIGDRFGRRKTLLVGLAIFGVGSAAAMTRADASWLIAMRALLGVGAALVMPATLSTVTSTFPAAQRAKAVGTWAGVAGASAILGLLTSGLVLEQWSWRSVFAVNVVLAVVAIVGTLRVVPESADPDAPNIDWVRAAMAVWASESSSTRSSRPRPRAGRPPGPSRASPPVSSCSPGSSPGS